MPDSPQHWYCLRTQLKREHIAAAQIQAEGSRRTCPRIRFKRRTRRGRCGSRGYVSELPVRTLRARRVVAEDPPRARVRGVVHFGDRWPPIPEHTIAELRATVGDDDVHVIGNVFEAGDPVLISGGALDGLRAVVTRVMAANDRVAVLMDFLGRQTAVELPADALVREGEPRQQSGHRASSNGKNRTGSRGLTRVTPVQQPTVRKAVGAATGYGPL